MEGFDNILHMPKQYAITIYLNKMFGFYCQMNVVRKLLEKCLTDIFKLMYFSLIFLLQLY